MKSLSITFFALSAVSSFISFLKWNFKGVISVLDALPFVIVFQETAHVSLALGMLCFVLCFRIKNSIK